MVDSNRVELEWFTVANDMVGMNNYRMHGPINDFTGKYAPRVERNTICQVNTEGVG